MKVSEFPGIRWSILFWWLQESSASLQRHIRLDWIEPRDMDFSRSFSSVLIGDERRAPHVSAVHYSRAWSIPQIVRSFHIQQELSCRNIRLDWLPATSVRDVLSFSIRKSKLQGLGLNRDERAALVGAWFRDGSGTAPATAENHQMLSQVGGRLLTPTQKT